MNISSISNISTQITNNIFSKIDTNNQGYIDKSGLTSALSKISSESSQSDTDDVFNKMDSDGDGKLTKTELSKGIENLLSQLQSNSLQSSQSNSGGIPPPDGMKGMPPPPPPSGDKDGVTQDQANEIASNTDDTKLASIMKTISENFEAADANQDGKVSAQEAMAYQQKSNAEGSTTSASTGQTHGANNIMQQLIKAYGFDDQSSNSFLMNVSA